MFLHRSAPLFMTILHGIVVVTIFTSSSALAALIPGVPGSTDGLCTELGDTVCDVIEGQSDAVPWKITNGGNVDVTIVKIRPGAIIKKAGDLTDIIQSDPISADACSGVTLIPGQSCLLSQAFTTDTPGDIDDNQYFYDHGTSDMTFWVDFTPCFGLNNPNAPQCNNLLNGTPQQLAGVITIAGPGVLGLINNLDGTWSWQIDSATVKVTDVPEPSSLLLLASGLLGLAGIRRKKLRGGT